MTRFQPLSHLVAARLTLAARASAEVEVTAAAVRLLLAVLSCEASVVDDDENAFERTIRRQEHAATGEVHFDALWISPNAIRETLGGISPAALRGDLARIRSMRFRLLGDDPGPEGSPVSGGFFDRDGKPSGGKGEVACVQVERTLLAHAGGTDPGRADAVLWVDFERMEHFRCRHSPLAYVRIMAWVAAPERLPDTWRAHGTAGGALSVTIPASEIAPALGYDGRHAPSDLVVRVLKPVAADLAWAGVRFAFSRVRNRRDTVIAWRLQVAEDEALRTERLREEARMRRARRAERKLVRRANRPAIPPIPDPQPSEANASPAKGLARFPRTGSPPPKGSRGRAPRKPRPPR